MNNFISIKIPIEDLMIWKSSKWMDYVSHSNKTYLYINYDQLLLVTENKILEKFSLNLAIKGVYKGAVLILFFKDSALKTRKLRFLIKSNVTSCIDLLKRHFTVTEHESQHSENTIQPQYKKINEVFEDAINGMISNDFSSIPLPQSYNNFVKLALLDPTLPQFVCEIQKILNDLTNENDEE